MPFAFQPQAQAKTVSVPAGGVWIPLLAAPRTSPAQFRLYTSGANAVAWAEGKGEAEAKAALPTAADGLQLAAGASEIFAMRAGSTGIFVLPKASTSEVNVTLGVTL